MQTPISIVIITKNEESIIEDCLNAIKWCEDVVIVDSGSSDRTLEIAKKHGCRIFHKDFNGFGEQKQYAVSLANNDWVLSLDADEIIDSKLKDFFLSSSFIRPEIVGYEIKRLLVYMNRKLIWNKFRNDKVLRFFNKKHCSFNTLKVHEKIITTGKTETLDGFIFHYSYRNLTHHIEKINSYTTLAAQVMFEKNKKTSIPHVFLKTIAEFTHVYLIQGAIFDGFIGLCWTITLTYYKALKYFKLREMYTLNSNKIKS